MALSHQKKRSIWKCLYTSLKSPEYATTINPALLPVCSKSLKVFAFELASNWTTSQSNICFVSQCWSRQILPDSSDLFRPPPGPDWLIGRSRKIPVGPFWFFHDWTVMLPVAWLFSHGTGLTYIRDPVPGLPVLTSHWHGECSLVGDVITFWPQPMELPNFSLKPAVLVGGCWKSATKWITEIAKRGGGWKGKNN